VLVTGCAGFIGSRTATLLLDAGREVVGLDEVNDAYDPDLKEWRLAQLGGRAGFRFLRGDVADPAFLARVFETRGAPFAAVYHLAARAGVRASVETPLVYHRTNIDGTLAVLDACRRYDVQRVVIASTSSAYGRSAVPFREDAPADRPLSPYAASKRAAELVAHSYHHLYGLDIAIPRYFTVYGPAGRPDMSIFRIIEGLLRGKPFHLHGDGSQSRDFTYVDDIARGTMALAGVRGYEIVNLGNHHPESLANVIRRIEGLAGGALTQAASPRHRADVDATWADIGKANRLLGWMPQVSLAEGLRRTVAWHQTNRDWLAKIDLGVA
jgi:nucleoside-diphosphate-sugar epimerase